jgi:16S rRNA processing protein RimM
LKERCVLVGVIASAHGTKGEVKVKAFTARPEGLGGYGPVQTEDGRQLEIAALRRGKSDEVIVAFAGIADRNMAETLKAQRLYVPREVLPEPDSGEFYHADLVGLRAQDGSGKTLGTVRGVHNFGAGDILEIEFSGGTTEFLAFSDANVPVVDVAGGYIVIEPPRDAED